MGIVLRLIGPYSSINSIHLKYQYIFCHPNSVVQILSVIYFDLIAITSSVLPVCKQYFLFPESISNVSSQTKVPTSPVSVQIEGKLVGMCVISE